MPPEASARYKFARNPRSAIISAIVDQINQSASNPRAAWRLISTSVGVDGSSSIELSDFCSAVKGLGTGIQLEPCDIELAFGGPGPVDFGRFATFLAQ